MFWEGKGLGCGLVCALDTWIPRHLEGAGKAVVAYVGSQWWVGRMLAEYGEKQVLGGRFSSH